MHPRCAMFGWSLCSPLVVFGCIVIKLFVGAIRLCIVWLLPEKRNAWECLVYFIESAYVVTCNVRSVCFAYVEGSRFPNPHRMVEYIWSAISRGRSFVWQFYHLVVFPSRRQCDVGLEKMHIFGSVENIRPVAENILLFLFYSPLVSCSECLHRRWRNYVSFTIPVSVTSPLYSHRFDSIQILNSQVHALCLPPPFGFFFFFIDLSNNVLWHCLGELGDLSLRSLSFRLDSTIIASRAPGTTEAYRRAFRDHNKREPVSPDMTKKLVEKSNLNNLLQSLNVCFFIIAWAGFFRIEEILHLKYGDISFHRDHVTINVDRSKTD